MTVPRLLCTALVIAVTSGVGAGVAAADPAAGSGDDDDEPGARWTLMLGGGALAPIGAMRDDHQDALVAGLRFGVRARIGVGVQLAVDYSPLPHKMTEAGQIDTAYGTVGLLPSWTFGHGVVRFQVGAGGGLALEHSTSGGETTDARVPAAMGQLGLELWVTRGGGIVLLGGATQTFGDREYRYGWGMGALAFEF